MNEPVSFHENLEAVLGRIIQGFLSAMKQHGLSTPQIHALMYIHHFGGCQVSDMAMMAEVSNAAASQLVERLVQQGLVERREDPQDRRYKLVTLSTKGKELIRESVVSNQFWMEIMAALAPGQRQTIHEAFLLMAQKGEQIQDETKSQNR